jgi:DNA-directed RNA polymerase specialized sigma24 family protein
VSCIEGDELDAAGVTSAELEEMITGPDNQRLRNWLEGLSLPLRVVFVLRAVAGLTSAEVAGQLAENGGTQAENWTPDAVRSTFRQALCSLASQLLHATASR